LHFRSADSQKQTRIREDVTSIKLVDCGISVRINNHPLEGITPSYNRGQEKWAREFFKLVAACWTWGFVGTNSTV